MVNLMRKYQQTLMVIVTFVVIIAFAWLYNNTNFDARRCGSRGQSVLAARLSHAEYQRVRRKFEVCQMLGMYEMLSGLGYPVGSQRSRNDVEDNFVWNSFILRHEADALEIQPTDAGNRRGSAEDSRLPNQQRPV